MRATVEKSCRQETRDVVHGNRTIGDALARHFNLDERLKPIETTRTRCCERDGETRALGLNPNCCANAVCANGAGAGIAGNENARAHERES